MSSGAFRMTQDSHTWVVVVGGVGFAQVPFWAAVGGIRAYLPWSLMQPQEFLGFPKKRLHLAARDPLSPGGGAGHGHVSYTGE